MMSQTLTPDSSQEIDLRQIVISNSTFGPNEITHIVMAISSDYNNFRLLRDAVGEILQQEQRTPATSARLGVCQYLLGRYKEAVQTLSNADGGALTHFYLGKSYLDQNEYGQALAAYESAEKAGYPLAEVALAQAEEKKRSLSESVTSLQRHGEQMAEDIAACRREIQLARQRRVDAEEGIEAAGKEIDSLYATQQQLSREVEEHEETRKGLSERLDEIRVIAKDLGRADVNAFMKRLFRERSWGDMAESETYAHLEHLRLEGKAEAYRNEDRRLVYEL